MKKIKKRVKGKLNRAMKKIAQKMDDPFIPKPSEVVKFSQLQDGELTFNMFVPTLDTNNIFGGIFTALVFLKEAKQLGFKVKITTFDLALSAEEKKQAIDFIEKYLDIRLTTSDINVVGEYKKTQPVKQEVFIATMYYTANFIKGLLRNNPFLIKKFVYFIQDFTPGFTPWSDDYAEALVSFQSDDFIPVFNSTFLKDFFVENAYIASNEYYAFRPQLQEHRLKPWQGENTVPKLIFYARPKRPRNLYKTGMQGLIDWLHEYKPAVEIFTAGQPHDDIVFEQWTIRSLGKMSADAYWDSLNQYDMGLSLMLSPHPSYPPLEMGLCGVVTVTNRYANKDLAKTSDIFVTCEPSAEGVKQALQDAYERAKDKAFRKQAAVFNVDSEASELEDVAKSITERFQQMSALQ